MTSFEATPDWAAYELMRVVARRSAIAVDFVNHDHKVDWAVVQERYDMLSSGEKAVVSLAAEIADVRVDVAAPVLYRVIEWCDNEYKVHIANTLTQLLLP